MPQHGLCVIERKGWGSEGEISSISCTMSICTISTGEFLKFDVQLSSICLKV